MLNKNGIFMAEEGIIFTNSFALSGHIELLYKIMNNMLNDLSIITGVDKEYLFKNYEYLNGDNIFKELLKEVDDSEEESLALMVMKKKLENI